MVDREALEQFESDSNPYAVDPRLTEGNPGTANEKEAFVLERSFSRRDIHWPTLFLQWFFFGIMFGAMLFTIQVVFNLARSPGSLTSFFSRPANCIPHVVGIVFGSAIGMGVNMALFRKKTVKLHIDGEKIFIEGDNHWFHLKTEKTRILPIRPYTSDWFVSLSSIHIPARYCIIFRQSRNKQFHLPCNDLSDQRQIMREIEQFLKRY